MTDRGVVPIRPEEDGAWIARIQAECREELDAYGLSHQRASVEIGRGVSPGTLSGWLSGTYKGDIPAVTRRVETWLATRREARARSIEAAGLDRHAELGVTEEVQSVLSLAQAAGELALIHGRPGVGKSWAARRYCATHTAAWHVQMTAVVRTESAMLSRLSEAVGAGGRHPSAADAERAIVARVQDRGALIVVDEAHHLCPLLLDELRCIRDVGGCGLVMIGGDDLWTALGSSPRCDQIVGRLAVRLPVGAPADADVSVLASGVLGRAPKPRELRLLIAAARGPGGLHALRRFLGRAWMIARAEGSDEIRPGDLAAAEDAA